MRIQCRTRDLAVALSVAGRALPTRAEAPILEGALLETCPEGLRVTCGSLEMGIETVIGAEVAEEGRIVLPGKLLTEVVRKLTDDTLELEAGESLAATLRCQRSKTTLAGMRAEEYPALPRAEGGGTVALPQAQLRELVQGAAFAASTTPDRPMLTGCLLEIDPDELRMVALDGFRLALRAIAHAHGGEATQAVIPAALLQTLAKLADAKAGDVQLHIGSAHLSADLGATRVVIRLLAGEFTRYRRILPTEHITRVKAGRAALEQAVSRARLLATEGKNNLVRMHIADGMLSVTSRAEMGDTCEELEIELDGPGLDIAFNVRYLADALAAAEDEEICLRFTGPTSPCEIVPVQGDAYRYLVLPVRTV